MKRPNTPIRLLLRALFYACMLVISELIMNNLTFIVGLFFFNYELIIHNVYYLYSYKYLNSTKPVTDALLNQTVSKGEIITRRGYAKDLLDMRTRDKWKTVKRLSDSPQQVILADLLHIGEIDRYRKDMRKGTFQLAFFPFAWGIGLYKLGYRIPVLISTISLAIIGVVIAMFFHLANNEFLMLQDTNFSFISESIYYEFFSLIFLLFYIVLTRIIISDFILDRRQTKALNEALRVLLNYYDKLLKEEEEVNIDVPKD